ncbi:hypothetical protein MBLNU457_1902t2 [Dothideomycetes sp. NU457]
MAKSQQEPSPSRDHVLTQNALAVLSIVSASIDRAQPCSSRNKATSQIVSPNSNSRLRVLISMVVLFIFVPSSAASVIPSSGTWASSDIQLLFDTRPAPTPVGHLARRQELSHVGAVKVVATKASEPSSSTTASDSTTSNPSALPRPFDTTLGNNFTSPSCPAFFNNFLHNASFTACLPLSLLLQTSYSFVTATRSNSTLSATLDATCNVNATHCSSLMASLARQIRAPSNCGADYTSQNPTVLQAYAGFSAYTPLYQAGCLKSNQTGNYCFVDAATSLSNPAGQYIYYLPLGVDLPSGAKVGCTQCVKDTMAIFAESAAGQSSALAANYLPAATQIDQMCGSDFVSTSVARKSAGARTSRSASPWSWMGLCLVCIFALVS